MRISYRVVQIVFLLFSMLAFCGNDLNQSAIDITDENQLFSNLLTDAEKGDAGAQYLLGFMYAEGQGIKKDFKEAIKWYTLAANQGYEGAQLTLGMMYAEGQAVQKDCQKAFEWYTKAAEHGNAGVQLMLAAMVAEGQGVEISLVEAYKWTILAEMNGEDIAENKSHLKEQMTDRQIDKAYKRVKEYAEKFPNAVTATQKIMGAGRYASTSDGFSVWFPSPPSRTVNQGTSTLHSVYYQSFAGNGTQYNVSFQYNRNKKKAKYESQTKLLEDYLIGRAMFAQDNTIQKKYARFKGYNAAQFKHATRSGGIETIHEGIVFLVKGDFVSLTCVYPSSLSPSPPFNEYVNTFEFSATEPAKQPQ